MTGTPSEWISLGNSSSLNPSNAITVEAWIYPTTAPPDGYGLPIVNRDDSWAGTQGFAFSVIKGPCNGFANPLNIYDGDISLCSNATVPINQWSHVAFTMSSNGSTKTAQLYLNGNLVGQQTVNGTLRTNSLTTYVGRRWGSSGGQPYNRAFDGIIDEVRISNKVRQPNEFTATASMTSARFGQTATLLPNGKVLLAGGYDGSAVSNTAELYDPAGGTFTAISAPMNSARESPTATLLPNGKVLIAGGYNGVFVNTAELYDPPSGTFTATVGRMNTARYRHTATLLPNGKVLIAGGESNGSAVSAAELYDPTSGTFTATSASMTSARREHTATLLPNGRVLIAGGSDGIPVSTAELYDPASGTFTATSASMTSARGFHTATLLPNGKVLIAGGSNVLVTVNKAELYDPVGGTFTATSAPMTSARYAHTATLLPNGKVLIAGGSNGSTNLNTAELYDAADGTFTATSAPMTSARNLSSATLLPNGEVLIAGGYNGSAYSNTAELYDPSSGTFTATSAPMSSARQLHTATLLPNGKVLIAGGYNGSAYLNAAELYDPASGTFTATSAPMTSARASHTATLLPNGKVLIAGGTSEESLWRTAELYDPVAETFTATSAPMTSARLSHTATLLPNGKVLVAGGNNGSSAELYDPAGGTFTAISAPMNSAWYHTATLLPNGKVLITGGYNGSADVNTAELYDPAGGTFTATSTPMTSARRQHTATLLPNGKVLIAGGFNGSADVNTAELYDPASGTFTATSAPMTSARFRNTATLLPNGTLLIFGGNIGSAHGNTAELYDPAGGTFTATSAPMTSAPRFHHTATLLPNGNVLIAGGTDGIPVNTAELYDTGLGFSDARRPVIFSAPAFVNQPASMTLGGSGFRGDSEASGGSFNSSPTNYPLLQLQRLDNEQTLFVTAGANWSNTTFTSAILSGLANGHYRATILTNAIPSLSRLVVITLPTPTITNVNPASGPAAGGQSVTITGTNLSGANVTIGGNTATVTGTTPTTATFTTPAHAAGVVDVIVTTADGSATSTGGYTYIALTITNINPISGPVAGGQSVTITGTSLSNATSVTFGGTPGTITANTATSITVTTPAHSAGAVNVVVSSAGGSATSTGGYTYGELTITNINPTSGPLSGGQSVTISGTNLSGASVTIGGNTATVTGTTATTAIFTTPAHAAGVVDVMLTTAGGSATSTRGYTYVAAPTITNINPSGGPVAGGQSVTITGTNLSNATSVTFGGTAGTITANTATFITVITPAQAAGTANVVVSTAGGSATSTFFFAQTNLQIKTVILSNVNRMIARQGISSADAALLNSKVQDLANHPLVQGYVVDLGGIAAITNLYATWDASPSNPDKANAVLFGTGGIHDYLTTNLLAAYPAVKYLVVVGDDRIIPMARIQDRTFLFPEANYPAGGDITSTTTTVGQALAAGKYLTDDPLAVVSSVSTAQLSGSLFLPDLSVGRLVETPEEIVTTIATFIGQNGLLDLTLLDPLNGHKVLITGYDFLANPAIQMRARWKNALGLTTPVNSLAPVNGSLIGGNWGLGSTAARATALRTNLAGNGGARYGVMGIAGHATHYEEGVPGTSAQDIVGLSTADIYGPDSCNSASLGALDLSGAFVYSLGCHGGLSVPGSCRTDADHSLDLPQTMLRRGAVAYLANTGYGWGLRFGIGYGGRLAQIFTEQMTSAGTFAVGDVVRQSKQRYYLETPRYDPYDEKSVMQWMLYGLPMYTVKTGIATTAASRSPVMAANVVTEKPGSISEETLGAVRVKRQQQVPNQTVASSAKPSTPIAPHSLPSFLTQLSLSFDFTASGVYEKHDSAGSVLPAGPGCPDANGCYYTLNGLTDRGTGSGDLPVQPYLFYDSRLSGSSQHGVLWKGGTYDEESGWKPVIAQLISNGGDGSNHGSAPQTIILRPTAPRVVPGGDSPTCRVSDLEVNSLTLTTGEAVKNQSSDLSYSIARRYRNIDLEAFYYNNQTSPASNCDRNGPSLGNGPYHQLNGSTISWAVPATDLSGVWRVLVVYNPNTVNTQGQGTWTPLDLTNDGTGTFRGNATVSGTTRVTYVIEAVDNRGNVTWLDYVSAQLPSSGVPLDIPNPVEAALSIAITAPTGVVATATSSTRVAISWNAIGGVASYDIYRSASTTNYAKIGSSGTTNYTDNTAAANTAYLYAVKAIDAESNASMMSSPDLATTVIFTDPSLTVGSTLVQAVHVTQLRTAVNAVRTLALLGAYGFTDPSITPGVIRAKAAHITDLRAALDAARTTLALSAVTYVDPTLTPTSTRIRAAHIIDLRNGVR